MPDAPPPCPPITALILAGGRGTRMGGADKGLQHLHGVPLAQHALQRLRRQSLAPAVIAINANRNHAAYRALGVPVWPDAQPGFAGPLAGMLSGLAHASTPLLLTVPCDAPRFPLSFCERLAIALLAQEAEIAIAWAPATGRSDQAGLQPQPVFCLLRATLAGSLRAFVQSGGRKVRDWTAQHRCAPVAFDQPGDDPLAFANLNTLAELQALQESD